MPEANKHREVCWISLSKHEIISQTNTSVDFSVLSWAQTVTIFNNALFEGPLRRDCITRE